MFDLQRPQLIHIGPGGRKLSRVAGSTHLFYTTCMQRRNRGKRRHIKDTFFPTRSFNVRINWNNKNPALKISELVSSFPLSLSLYIYIYHWSFFNPDTRCYGMVLLVDRRSALVIRIMRTFAVIRRWIFSSLVFVRDSNLPLVHSRACPAKIDRAERRLARYREIFFYEDVIIISLD